jgi:hypothetical protein
MPHPFEKDFGYLEPFLQKVRAYARSSAEPAARTRLSALMDEEIARWKEIRALLDGTPAGAPPAGAPPAGAPPAGAPPAGQAAPGQVPLAGHQWTVGRLFQDRSSGRP